jgi:general secretion pathway protein D
MQAKAGDSVLLNLVLVGGKELKGVHAEMDYPNDVLAFQGADEGTFLKLGGAPTSFVAKEVRPGLVMFDMSRTDGSGASGSGLVARVRFAAQKAGSARANFGVAEGITAAGDTVSIPPSFSIITVQAPPAGPGGAGGP